MTEYKFANTAKQQEILDKILTAADIGISMTLEDLYSQLSYKDTCTKWAVNFSVRILVKYGLLVWKWDEITGLKYIMPTTKAYEVCRTS